MFTRSRTVVSAMSVAIGVAQVTGASAQQTVPSPQEQVFVAFATPCRIFDSHATAPLANNADTNAFINLAGYNYPSQGGTNGGCGVPASATSVAISITTSGGSSNGFVTVTPGGNPASTTQASFLPNSPETAGMSVGLRANRITLHPTGGTVQARVDINGYYAPQIEAQIYNTGVIYSATTRILSSVRQSTGTYTVTADRTISTCLAIASIYAGPSGTSIIYNTSGPSIFIKTYFNNTLTDEAFQVFVSC